MLLRIFVLFIVLIGILAGCLVVAIPHEQIVRLIAVKDFLDISLPILAFGALVKYLCSFQPRAGGKWACRCGSKGCASCYPPAA